MKINSIILALGIVAGSTSLFAGPGPQFWNRPASKLVLAKQDTTIQNGLTCPLMASLNRGSAKGPQWIKCTPETMRTDARCQAMCASDHG